MSPARVEITCVRKDLDESPSKQITHIGGFHPDGMPWFTPVDSMMEYVVRGAIQYFVKYGDKEIDVTVASTKSDTKYLVALDDGYNRLLDLQECPPLQVDS
jgi:hypothetical protein